MCLSTVYLNERNENTVAGKDISELFKEGERITIRTLFGEEKSFDGYDVGEVSLTENYVILRKDAEHV